MSYQQNINAGLDRAYAHAPLVPIDISDLRLAVLSDLHRGAGDGADDFLACKAVYRAALEHYQAAGRVLAVLGDVEDLWECRPSEVVAEYAASLQAEKPFLDVGRYWRFLGNHDEDWHVQTEVHRYLDPLLGRVGILEALRLEVTDRNKRLGEVFLVHGHQGTAWGDRYGWLSHWVVHYLWRPIQRLTKLRRTTPATDWRLARKHELAMYNWAVQKPGVLVIAGHTHHPVFPSPARFEQLIATYDDLRHQPEAYESEVLERFEADLAFAQSQEQPCFINTGCCSFSDGSCTGIEIDSGDARLVRWRMNGGRPERKVLASARLKRLLADIAAPGLPAAAAP
jgi:UDP-2,3-diacylglucosamine pyrophosphatase LpxH